MSELIRKLKEKKFITKVKFPKELSDEILSKEITQRGSVKIIEEIKKGLKPVAPEIVVTRETNPELMDICVANGWAANNDYMTYEETILINDDDVKPTEKIWAGGTDYVSKFTTLTHFEEFQWFNGVESISYGMFKSCSRLTSIIIPNSVTSLGGESFYGCSGLTSIEIPNSVTTIGATCFYNCTNLASIRIPSSVTSIGGRCFYGCSNLISITIDSNNTKYDSRDNCNAIIETSTNNMILGCKTTVIPSSVTSLGNECFYGCSNLISITLPENLTSIGGYCFSDCSGLTSIEIPSSVTSLSGSCFYNCTNLASIKIPSSVTSLDSDCFSGCVNLTSITCLAMTAPTVSSGTFGSSPYYSYYTGLNTYNQDINKLKIPTGATGYDTGAWLDPLQNAEKCGFTIEYI